MTIKRLIAICIIIACTTAAWFLLGGTLQYRSSQTDDRLGSEVVKNWGPVLEQEHPSLFYEAPTSGHARRNIQPEKSDIAVTLNSEPKQKGLLWYRTYKAEFTGKYVVKNPTPIAQTIYASFKFPAADARYDAFSLQFGDKVTDKSPVNGEIRESLLIPPGGEAPLTVTYRATGLNRWTYSLKSAQRLKNLHLAMTTNFTEIDIPPFAESPTSRTAAGDGMTLQWDYTDVIGANAIAMDMPAVTNPGSVAGRITFFAPVSLLFFFSVLVLVGIRERTNLHPMNYFFLAAGCFAFQLLFAYLVDLLPLTLSFFIAAAVSLVLVAGYLWRATTPKFAAIAALAQFAYMVLFSYSFFFEGLTGITITIGAIVTLALLMAFTARIKWETALTSGTVPPPMPSRAA
ncbi:MAG TPA: inner membrane CreD family protein [Chthoniobacteraceae bacterium]|jgi:hypothetical protein|nr:inner membrane CreD family protein [Chthoniobacteraceae bacterium]